MKHPLLAALLFALGGAAVPAAHAQAPAPATAAAPHKITGFRSARFGMTAAEVRAAIMKDFQAADNVITEVENPVEKTRVLAVRLASLAPAPGPAVLAYVLGARSQRLERVNVTWRTGPAPTETDRNAMGAAGVQLAGYLQGLGWKPGGMVTGVSEGPNAVLLFAGVDDANAAVELHLTGVYLTGTQGISAPPSGPTVLRVAYIRDLKKPDVAGQP